MSALYLGRVALCLQTVCSYPRDWTELLHIDQPSAGAVKCSSHPNTPTSMLRMMLRGYLGTPRLSLEATEQSDTCWHLHRKHFFISSQHCVIRPHFHLKVSCLLTHVSNPIFSGMLSEQEFPNSSIPAELVNWLSLISQQDTGKTFNQ